ncbi:hypothetical protein [Methylocystis bryophila]|uniref:Uncharacterized protein n=1 Tax=Methylocystis bryophila TaxID=655015 RepID=A0A1W6MTN9_9HYPH|nr:hypothetical protein [Methylocystis bryophila]ARN80964.1 hypothetical protein B1812_07615 [Methylocystis bryophila]
MRSRTSFLLLAAASLLYTGTVAQAASLSCADFRQNPDGSWTPVRRSVVVGPRGPFSVEPGEVFHVQLQGTTNYGANIAESLNARCR